MAVLDGDLGLTDAAETRDGLHQGSGALAFEAPFELVEQIFTAREVVVAPRDVPERQGFTDLGLTRDEADPIVADAFVLLEQIQEHRPIPCRFYCQRFSTDFLQLLPSCAGVVDRGGNPKGLERWVDRMVDHLLQLFPRWLGA